MQIPVTITWTLAVLIEVFGPLVAVAWFQTRYQVGWRPVLYGAAVFFVFQVVLRIPAVQVINAVVAPRIGTSIPLQLIYLAGLALTAALFESVGRWAGYKWLFRDQTPLDWKNGVAYGLGHGGIESILLVGLSQAANLVLAIILVRLGVDFLGEGLPQDTIDQLEAARQVFLNVTWYTPLWAALERVLTIPFHVGMSLLVLQLFVRKQSYWLWMAVGLHALVDFTAPALLSVAHLPVWTVEAYIALWTAFALFLIWKLKVPAKEAAETSLDPAAAMSRKG